MDSKISKPSILAAALLFTTMGASAAVMDDAIIKYCNERPDDPQCQQLTADLDGLCRINPFLSSCKGLCATDPNHPACKLHLAQMDLDGLCRKNPFLPACKGLCAADPNHPACKLHIVKKNDEEAKKEKPPKVLLADFNSLKGFQAAFQGVGPDNDGVTASLGGGEVPPIRGIMAGGTEQDDGELDMGGNEYDDDGTKKKQKPTRFAILLPEP